MTATNDKPEWAQSKREKENAQRVAQGLKPKRRIAPWIVLGVVVVGAAAFFLLQPPAPEPVATIEESAVVKQILRSETFEIRPSTLRQTVKVTGTLVPSQQSDVAAQASGRVLSVAVRPGDEVAAGAKLVEIDRENLELQLNQQRATADATRAQLLSSRQQLDRTVELARQGLTSPSALEQARSSNAALEANLAALETAVRGAELALSKATVTSPITGIIASRSVEPGQTVSAGAPLMTVVNLDRMEFQAAASVNSSALVGPGQSVEVTVTGLDSQSFTGTVKRVNPIAVSGTRTVPIYIDLDNASGNLRGGMFATGFITVTEKVDAVAVPSTAVREDASGNFVLKLVDGSLVRQGVELGQEWDRGRTVEVEGVAVGETIIGAPLTDLADGEVYEVVED